MRAAPTVPLWEMKAMPPRGGEQGPGSAEFVVRVVDALAVGPDEPDPGAAGRLDQLFLELLPVLTRFGKAAGNDDGGLDPFLTALLDGPGHGLGRNDHHGQIRRAGDIGDLLDRPAIPDTSSALGLMG